MTGIGADQNQDQLALRSRLSDLAQVPGWIEGLSSRHAIPENVQLAINLCLEEALSNIIRHGCAGAEDRPVVVQFTMPRSGYIVFVIDDEAPLFNPLDAPELPPINPREEIRVGGQGIRFLRSFADTLAYEQTPTGNRLRIGFSIPGAALKTK